MKRQFSLLLTLITALFHYNAFANFNSLILLKVAPKENQFKILSSDGPKIRYQKTMKHLKQVKDLSLKKFIQDKGLSSKKYDLLPLVDGIAMDLNQNEINLLKSDYRVYKILPNTPVYLDKPVSLGPMTWSGGGGGGRTDPQPRGEFNEALILHKVDLLVKEGIDLGRAGKIVGVVDTGVDGKHPALANKVVAFKDIATGSTDPVDSDTHGTHVSGIIAGAKIDGTQIGVYPGAKLVVASALSGINNMVKGLEWIMDPDGNPETPDQPFVVNNSWHIGSANPEPFYRVIEAFKSADILLAFSAGNAGSNGVTKPKEHPFTFTSASVKSNGEISSFSSWGPARYNGQEMQKPEVASMGEAVYSTLPNNRYGKMSGTSMASPFTAGAVALLGAHFPQKSPYLIAEILRQTTVDQQNGGQWHRQMGFGLVDVYAAFLKLKETKHNVLMSNSHNSQIRIQPTGFQNSRTR